MTPDAAAPTPSPAPDAPRPDLQDLPAVVARGDARALAAALRDARHHTLALTDALVAGLGPQLELRYLPELDPPLWLLAELAWLEDGWISRNPLRRHGAASSEGFGRGPAPLPQIDRCFGERRSHADRWHQPVPGLRDTLALLQSSRQRTLALLRGTPHDDTALQVYRDALWREDLLAERLLGMAQTLGIAPGPLAATPARCGHLAGELGVPEMEHRLGAVQPGYLPGSAHPARAMRLAAFRIDRAPVTWARFLPFVEAGGYDDPAGWTPEGWAWRRRHSLGRPRHLGRSDDGHWQLAQFGQWVPLDLSWPAMHLCRHEAQAWCRWAGRRLPSEWEWEAAVRQAETDGSALTWGQVLEWTASAFDAPSPGAGQAADGSAPGGVPLFSLRGHSHGSSPRLAWPGARRAAAEDRNDGFTGFRSCSLEAAPQDGEAPPGPAA